MLTKLIAICATTFFAIILLPASAFAKEYKVPIIVNGQAYTLTVKVDGSDVNITTDTPDIEIGDLLAVDTSASVTKSVDESFSCKQILDNQRSMTRAQWLSYIEDGVKTQQIVDWQGTIVEVGGNGLITLGQYPIYIEVSPGCRIYYTEADEKVALSYQQGEKVKIAGTIRDLVVLLGEMTLYVDDDSFSITKISTSNNAPNYATIPGDGFYTIGTEIETGLWESEDGFSNCYWALLDANQDTLKNHFGVSGGVINISKTAQELEIRGCGLLTQITPAYLQDKQSTDRLQEPKDDGFYMIGIEIAPGVWETENGRDSCYWALLDNNQETLKNHFGPSGGRINLTENFYELEIRDCGKLSPVSINGNATQLTNNDSNNKVATVDNTASTGAVANRGANLRSGPGTNYAIAGSVQAGQILQIVAKNNDGNCSSPIRNRIGKSKG